MFKLQNTHTVFSLLLLVGSLAFAADPTTPQPPPDNYFRMADTVRNNFDRDDDLPDIRYLTNFDFMETHQALTWRLIHDVMAQSKKGQPRYYPLVYREILGFFEHHGVEAEAETLIRILKEMKELFQGHKVEEQIRDDFEKAINAILNEGRKRAPITYGRTLVPKKETNEGDNQAQAAPRIIPVAMGDPDKQPSLSHIDMKDLDDVHALIEDMRQYMEANIFGDPDLIESFMDLERSKLIFGQDKPRTRMMVGLGSSGRNTVAEVYTDAIHGEVGAHEKHMYRMPVIRNHNDLWKVSGSNAGHQDSNNFPPLLKFLVEHSGGRYQLNQKLDNNRVSYFVTENPGWSKETPMPFAESPQNAVIYIDGFHNWSKQMKDDFFKPAKENGLFEINNPNGGLDKIYVPVTFVISTNEGVSLLSPRELNGQRYGAPPTAEELESSWQKTHNDKQLIRDQLMASNGGVNQRGGGREEALGISEAVVKSFQDSEIILPRPKSPEALRQIVEVKLRELKARLKQGERLLGELTIVWDQDLPTFIQEYHYVPDDNGRPMEDNVNKLVATPLIQAFEEKKIEPSIKGQTLNVRIETTADLVSELVIERKVEGSKTSTTIRVPIAATEQDRRKDPISDARIDEILATQEQITSQVFGVEDIVERMVTDSLINDESSRAPELKGTARVYMLLGMSSNGKTETAKRASEARFGKKNSLKIFDFSQVRSVDDLKVKILGYVDGDGNPVASEFMKEYDRTKGQMDVDWDEIANAPLHVLKALYDILREPVVTTFSDGKPRSMAGVRIFMTGNAGEDWFNQVPRGIPESQQLAAMLAINKRIQKDPQSRRAMLEGYFSPALINRVGENNIFIYGPMSYEAIRRLTIFKLDEVLTGLKPANGRRGWEIGFASTQDSLDLVEGIENAGFVLREQGASIDRFVKKEFEVRIRKLLLENKIPSGAKLTLQMVDKGLEQNERGEDGYSYIRKLKMKIYVEGRAEPLLLEVKGKQDAADIPVPEDDQYSTGIHEAGHELVRKAVFGDKTRATRISIIPGVTMIGGRWVYYAGLAGHRPLESYEDTRQVIIRDIAMLAGGYIAQTLVTKGGRHDSGKHNDMQRATKLAQYAVLHLGLSEQFGTAAVPTGKSDGEFIGSLGSEKSKIFTQEWQKLLAEGEALAEHVLLVNYHNALIPLGMELTKRGKMESEEIDEFYRTHKVYTDRDPEMQKVQDRKAITGEAGPKTKAVADSTPAPKTASKETDKKKTSDKVSQDLAFLRESIGTAESPKAEKKEKSSSDLALEVLKISRDAELLDNLPRPESVANIQAVVDAEKAKEVEGIALPAWTIHGNKTVAITPSSVHRCEGALE